MHLLKRLQQFRARFAAHKAEPEDIQVIDGWLKEAERLFLLKSLAEHDGIKYLVQIFTGEIAKINDCLLHSRPLTDDERLRLMDKRDIMHQYLNLFLPVEGDLQRLEDKLSQEGA